MRKSRKSLKKLSACILAAAMTVTLAAPFSPLAEVKAAGEEAVNLALGATATANDIETNDYPASKAIDGVVNREAAKPQSRWATNPNSSQEPKILTLDLGAEKTFQSFVIAWERLNITSYEIQTSETGAADGEWTKIYEKEGDDPISDLNENIHLAEPVTAQYVRLYVDGYSLNPGNWQSVSVYEFQIYEDQIPSDILPEENYCLEGTAAASDYEKTEGDTQAPGKAIDGDKATRWATNDAGNGTTARTLTITLPAAQRVQYFKINWEKTNIKKYTIDVNTVNDGEFQTVYTQDQQIDNTQQIISLESPVWAKQIRLNITEYGESVSNWWNVSVAEFAAYAVEPGSVKEDSTAQEIADVLSAPTVNTEEMKLEISETVPDGTVVEFLADYEQVVGKDGTIYQPLTEKEINLIYKVTKDGESAEGTVEHTVTIPGQYENAGTNAKPVVIPELAEWYGGTEEGAVTISDSTKIVYKDAAFETAATALAEDYKAEFGIELAVAASGEAAGDIVFEKDEENGLDEEGYIIDTDDMITVKAEQATGAYWATRSILQIAKLNENAVPMGITKDYPKFEVRSFSLDVARKPASMDMLEDVAKAMAYYKMNDFQVHLNDNLIFYENAFFNGAEDARDRAYTGFRLESDIKEGGQNKQDLTNTDLYYTQEEFRDFILEARDMGVSIVPEIDAPGHSGAFTKVRPDLMLPEELAVNGTRARAGEQFNLSGDTEDPNSYYSQSLAFVQDVWDEYLTEDMFDSSMTVHIGTDEYYGDADAFRHFSDDMIEFIQDNDRTVRMWGSLTQLAGTGTVDVRSENVQLNVWNTGYSNPKQMYNDGFDLINTLDGSLYMVPNGNGGRGGYGDYLATENLYNNWVPNNMGGTVIPAGSEQMLGSTFAIWNDNIDTSAQGISEVDNFERFEDALPVLASKNWGEGEDLTFDQLKETQAALGDAPGSNPYSKASADENNKYMSYEFEDKTDSSNNGRDLTEVKNADIKDGSLTLKGGESYVTTPIEKLSTGSTLAFDITLDAPAKAGQILFEADTPGSDDYAHDIRVMDDGRLGFRRELYDYYFDYKLPVGKQVHIEITTDTLSTTMTVDGVDYTATGIYRNRQTDNTVRKQGIKNATLLLPLQRIGSKTNAIQAEIDNVNVTVAEEQQAVDIYNKAGWTKVAVDSETIYTATEGNFEYAFDGKSGTIWHSNWQNASDKVDGQDGTKGNMDSIGGTINLGNKYMINQFSFTPRTGSASGQVTKADLYVKANEGDQWIKVAEDAVFAADASTKTFYFEEQEVQYIKFVAKESNDGWVAVSEFDVGNAPAQTYTVYVEAQEGGTAEASEEAVQQGEEVTVTAKADTGYTFAGWYDAVTGTKVSDDAEYTFAVTENTALTAQFTKNDEPEPEVTHTVTFVADGNETTQTVKDGETAGEPEKPTKAGHEFLGWFEEGSENAFDFGQPITGDVTLTARFEAYTVTPSTDANGTVSVGAMQADGSVTVEAEPNSGYRFAGWKVNDQIVSYDNPYTFTPVQDTEIAAVFEAVKPGVTYHTVTINEQTVQVEHGLTLAKPADPVKEGYKFIGWFVGDTEYDFSQPVTSDLTITAKFEKIETPGEGDSDQDKPGTDKPGADTQKPGSGNADKGDKGGNTAVQTGDQSSPVIWAVVLIVAVAAVAAVVIIRKKKK